MKEILSAPGLRSRTRGTFTATEFYADIEGHPEDANVQLAMEELRYFTSQLTVLGVYPADRTDPGQDFALRQMSVPHQPGPAVIEPFLSERGEERCQLGLNRLFDQLARTLPDEVRQWIRRKPRWIGQRADGSLRHVAYPFLG